MIQNTFTCTFKGGTPINLVGFILFDNTKPGGGPPIRVDGTPIAAGVLGFDLDETTLIGVGGNIDVTCDGASKHFTNRVVSNCVHGQQITIVEDVELGPSVSPFPPGAKRAPWGPPLTCGSCPSPDSYDKFPLPFTPPAQADVNFMRANAWSLEFPPGFLPFIPSGPSGVTGGSSKHPERLLTAYIYKIDQALWPQIFEAYRNAGLTHWVFWWPNARSDGYTLDQFLAVVARVKAEGFFTNIGLVSKDIDSRDQTPAQWSAYLDADYQTMLASGVCDEFAVWEWDLFNVPGDPTLQTFIHWGDMAHAAGKTFWAHFRSGYTSWQSSGDERGFWRALGTHVDGLQYQSDQNWDIGQLQSRIVDIYRMFADVGTNRVLRIFETLAEAQFDDDHPTELEGDQYNALALATKGQGTPGGYGGGAREQDGGFI